MIAANPQILARRGRELGGTTALTLLLLVGLTSVAAIAIDLGRARQVRWSLQKAADAAAFAAAKVYTENPSASDTEVLGVADAFAAENGLSASELAAGGGIEVGNWNKLTRVFTDSTPRNAVRIRARRAVNTTLARTFDFDAIYPKILSTSYGEAELTACAMPFGIESNSFIVNEEPIPPLTTFLVGSGAPGNWGKLSIPLEGGGYATSNGNNFEQFMLNNGICNALFPDNNSDGAITAADSIILPVDTGFSGIDNVFDTLALSHAEFVAVIIGDLPNGSSGTVPLLQFAHIRVDGSTGSGRNWVGTFTLIEYLDHPSDWVISNAERFMVE